MWVIAGIGVSVLPSSRSASMRRSPSMRPDPRSRPIIWKDMAAAGAMALPLILMVIGRRYTVAGVTFGVIREK
jgi:hypothetical protein